MSDYIPPTLLANLLPYFPLLGRIYTYLDWARWTMTSTVAPLLQRIQAQPDVSSVALLLVVLLVSFKILNMLRRAMVSWVVFSVRTALWSALAWGALRLYSNGFQATAAEVGAMAVAARDLWAREYQKAKMETRRNR